MNSPITDTETWELPLITVQDDVLPQIVQEAFTDIYQEWFAQEPMLINHDLPILVRALRRVENWRVFLLLTPWMLARVFIPVLEPSETLPIPVPKGWKPSERVGKPYTVIGPGVEIAINEASEKAHINYHTRIGHYFVQPLIQSMESFSSPEQVFEAWNNVLRVRNENIRKLNRRCRWQEDVSRREFFRRAAS